MAVNADKFYENMIRYSNSVNTVYQIQNVPAVPHKLFFSWNNITQYELYLPDKNELQAKLKSWIEEFEDGAE